MKSGLVGDRLSIAPLVASVQPVLEHVDGGSSDNFLWQPASQASKVRR